MAIGRKTGGRAKGTGNKKTSEFLKEVLGTGKTPLEILLAHAREVEPKKPTKRPSESLEQYGDAIREWEKRREAWRVRVIDAAKAAAPYCHPKLVAAVNPLDFDKPPVQKLEVSFVGA